MSDATRRPIGRRRRFARAFAEMHYALRTEADTPGRKALSVWLGTFLGCLPIYGLHLAVCAFLAKWLGLSRVRTYLAAHVNNPLTLPPLLYFEIGIGRWLRTGGWPQLSLTDLTGVDPWGLGHDLVVGSVVLGVALGAAFGGFAWIVAERWKTPRFHAMLHDLTTERYMACGIRDWEFARGKLRFDPVYLALLRSGALPPYGRILDLGCGRGLLLALIRTAQRIRDRGDWGADWPEPPREVDLHGIEIVAAKAERARVALAGEATIEIGDVAEVPLPPAAAVAMLDVLHYLPRERQDRVLDRVAEAVEPGGVLLIREADADRGWRFAFTRAGERLAAWIRHNWGQRFHYRGARAWVAALEARGFAARAAPMWAGTPHGNVLIEARRRGPGATPA